MNAFRLLPLLLPLVAGAGTTDPVGVVTLKLRGSSDTVVSLPVLRPALVAQSSIQAVDTTAVTLTLTAGVPAIPADSGAYVLVLTGALEGAVLPIMNFDGVSTLTVGAGAYNLSRLHTEAVNGATHGDLAAVVPYWTLDTVFPSGAGVNIAPATTTRNTEIQLYDAPLPGTQVATNAIFYYYVGNSLKPAGWYQLGSTAPMGGQRLTPGHYFVVRNKIAGDHTVYLSGTVQMAGYSLPISTLAANTAQDNPVALPIAVGQALSSANLVDSGAFTASASSSAIADELLTYDNTVVQTNKFPSATYYYCSGGSGQAAGWYQEGAALTPVALTLAPSQGVIIRKKASAAAQTRFWTGVPSYLQ